MKNKKALTVTISVLMFIILVALWILYTNINIEINEYAISSSKIPNSFNNFKIAQVSDLHNAEFGKNNQKLIDALNHTNADIIVITGDMIDSRRTNINSALSFVKEAVKIAPVYYITGNHESNKNIYKEIKPSLIEYGVKILENESEDIIIGNDKISIIGIMDLSFYTHPTKDNQEQKLTEQLSKIVPDNDNYKILLAHRPEYFSVYSEKADLILCGHAHGGQFIIPFAGGLYAPGQGCFPEYYSGIYNKNNSSMVVSRGIGNSTIPIRINNSPEIAVTRLVSSYQ